MLKSFSPRPRAWKGIVAGMAGGLAATVVMTQFQKAWSQLSENHQHKRSKKRSEGSSRQHAEKEDATMKAAGKVALMTGDKLSHEQKKKAGPYVHYGFGTAMGALYGLAHEYVPRPARSWPAIISGSGYGTALFVGADEVAVPALGLSKAPGDTPISSHIYGWLSHLVYGVTLEAVRKGVRRSL
jgi:putative membrane protein